MTAASNTAAVGCAVAKPTTRLQIERHEKQRRQPDQRDGVLREHPESEANTDTQPSAAILLEKDSRQKVKRPGPASRQRRIGRNDKPRHEKERQHLQHHHSGPRRALIKTERGQPEDEKTGHEVTEKGKDANSKFTVAKHHCPKIYQPGDHRWMIEIADIQMSGVEPIVGLLRKKVGPAESGQLQQEQPGHED